MNAPPAVAGIGLRANRRSGRRSRRHGCAARCAATTARGLPRRRRAATGILDWVRNRVELDDQTQHVKLKAPVLAALLEAELKPKSATEDEAVVWMECFDMVLEAYNGNVPVAFRGGLVQADNGITSDQLLPAGPESADEEMDFETREIVKTCGSACLTPLAEHLLVDLGHRVVRRAGR